MPRCPTCEDRLILHGKQVCRFSLTELDAEDQGNGLLCPRDLGSLAFSDPEDRATMKTVLLTAARNGSGDLLLQRYPPALREDLRRVAVSDHVSSTVREHRGLQAAWR